MNKAQKEHREDRDDKRGVIEGTPVEEQETTSPGKPGVIEGTAVEEGEAEQGKSAQP
jgi:hypothetical protein